MKKYILTILIIFTIFILSSGLAFAQAGKPQERALEVDYPDVPGPALTPQDLTTTIPEYVQYIYYFFLGTAGVIALIVIVNAGVGYLTSAGNPTKMQDSKDRIMAALLGLLILAGSYGILYMINPDLLTLAIPELQPLILGLEPGVLLCKNQNLDVQFAWNLIEDYKYATDNNERRAIKDVLTPLIDEIYKVCYTARTKEDIRPGFEDQIIEVWFIPLVVEDENGDIVRESSAEYGAVYYEDKGFEGNSYPYVNHLTSIYGFIPFKAGLVLPGMSSIAPFKLVDIPNPNWKVTLYEETNYNEQFAKKETMEFAVKDFANGWWDRFPKTPGKPAWSWSPKSMKIEGNLLVILLRHYGAGLLDTESFFKKDVANLEKYESIVEKVPCKDYVSKYSKACAGVGFGGSSFPIECCFKAAATEIQIIGAEPL